MTLTINGEAPRKGRVGNPGQAKGNVILHRIEGRQRARRALRIDEGVDVTQLLGFADRRIGHECAWVHGDPLEAGSGFCGKPVVEGTQWCEAHRARVYSKQGQSNA